MVNGNLHTSRVNEELIIDFFFRIWLSKHPSRPPLSKRHTRLQELPGTDAGTSAEESVCQEG